MAAPTAAQKSNFITGIRQCAGQTLYQIESVYAALNAQYVAGDLGNVLVDGDFVGDNAGISQADLVAAISSLDAIKTLLGQGHATNLYKVLP